MAETVDGFPVRSVSPQFPWDEWCDGQTWKLEPGVDFKHNVATFRTYIRNVSVSRNLEYRSRMVDGFLYLRFTKQEESTNEAN